ncbi:MAG TPA: GTPase Era [Candidatus Cloacimonas sp.]|jgi:GTP-binding protein Era|nr:GTPase Era [Candidatus Cloacimonas acidaminovorans]HRU83187.1 GTPase Era [Candidatus Cloacimonas sp.]
MNNSANFKSGFVTIIGKPNTGKSTLMNLILGEKISITSPKPQTTRYAIKGIWNTSEHQIIFVDTPGYLKPRYELQEKMLKIWHNALKDVDLIIFLTQIDGFPTEYDKEVLNQLKTLKNPQLAVFNKLDLNPEVDRNELVKYLPESINEFFFVSAKTGENIPELMEAIKYYIPFHEPYYDNDMLSDLPMRFFAQEIIREAIFHFFEEEIPYSSAVLIERFKEFPDKVIIDAVIWLERESQKPILIGKNGSTIKKVREYAERELTRFMQMPVQVHLFVKIKPKWRKKQSALRELGF